MTMANYYTIIGVLLLFSSKTSNGFGWDKGEKVLLKDVEVLTLYNGQMTAGRRSSPVPQLKCIGGSARCAFTPKVVQCYNRGWDGVDVQWECKSDMDNEYRFGNIQVSCEGYEYAQDSYILKGSCGLEYELDLTKEGQQKADNNYGYNSYSSSQNQDYYQKRTGYSYNNYGQSIALFVVVCIIIYAMYKTCIEPVEAERARTRTNQDYPPQDPPRRQPPPSYGFRNDYQGDSCAGSGCSDNRGGTSSPGAGNFWTGAATGGLLGYMFGARNNTNNYQQHQGQGGGWFGSGSGTRYRSTGSSWGSGSGSGGASTSAGSSGTRTASGFGGTTRR